MNAPDGARDDPRPLNLTDHANHNADAASLSIEQPDNSRPLDLAEVMTPVGRVVLGLAAGAELFLHRLRAQSPSFVAKPDGGDSSNWHRYKNASGRLELQHDDSVEAARLANVLARLLERYRVGLRDMANAEVARPSQPGRDT